MAANLSAFSQAASNYARNARLQQGVAWRLAHLCRNLPLLPGPVLDLGAGSGNLSAALQHQRPELNPLLVDHCAALLAQAQAPAEQRLQWDLNGGLPPLPSAPQMLLSSFALHWLQDPAAQLNRWAQALASGGWLALSVPVAGSLESWHTAAERAGMPCSALELPQSHALLNALPNTMELHRQELLHFSCSYSSPLSFLRELRSLGVHGGARHRPGITELRQLQRHWPRAADGGVVLRWRLLQLLARHP